MMLGRLLSFVTGSRKYGTPRPDSDVDMIVFVSKADLEILAALADPELPEDRSAPVYFKENNPRAFRAGDYDPMSQPLRFGRLNLICVTDPAQYDAWRAGTERLSREQPVTREAAVALLSKLRKDAAK
jgi:hypothetical protein